VSATLVLCLAGVLYPGVSVLMMLLLLLYAPLIIGSLALVNLVPGYCSLLSSRYLLHWLGRRRAPTRVIAWLILTGLATVTWATVAGVLGFLVMLAYSRAHLLRQPLSWLSGYVEFVLKGGEGHRDAVVEVLRLQPVVVPGVAFPSFGIWFYAPCFPMVWVCLYALSGAVVKWITSCRPLLSSERVRGLMDIDTRPLYTLGAVAAVLVSVVYWGVGLYLY
jgi:hypothetical protein